MIPFVKLSEKKEMFLCIVSSLISVYSFGKLAVLQIRGGTEDNSVIIFLIVTRRRRTGTIEMTLVHPCVHYSVRPSGHPSGLVLATPPTSFI